jgi:hypothetical protein
LTFESFFSEKLDRSIDDHALARGSGNARPAAGRTLLPFSAWLFNCDHVVIFLDEWLNHSHLCNQSVNKAETTYIHVDIAGMETP